MSVLCDVVSSAGGGRCAGCRTTRRHLCQRSPDASDDAAKRGEAGRPAEPARLPPAEVSQRVSVLRNRRNSSLLHIPPPFCVWLLPLARASDLLSFCLLSSRDLHITFTTHRAYRPGACHPGGRRHDGGASAVSPRHAGGWAALLQPAAAEGEGCRPEADEEGPRVHPECPSRETARGTDNSPQSSSSITPQTAAAGSGAAPAWQGTFPIRRAQRRRGAQLKLGTAWAGPVPCPRCCFGEPPRGRRAAAGQKRTTSGARRPERRRRSPRPGGGSGLRNTTPPDAEPRARDDERTPHEAYIRSNPRRAVLAPQSHRHDATDIRPQRQRQPR